MSTDYGIGCRTCAREGRPHFSGEWDNCRYSNLDGLRALIKARDVVVAAEEALSGQVFFSWNSYADLGRDGAYGVADFFRRHKGHELAPMDEYGQFEGDCSEWVTCATCGESHRCTLPDRHEGPHSPRGNR